MSDITEFLENPTISKITRQEKNKYQMSHINVMDLMRRMESLEKEHKNSEELLLQVISEHENEINRLKTICSELEKRIQKYETKKQPVSVGVQKTTIPVKTQKKTVKIGEIIKLGRYEGKDVEWQVLDVNKNDNSVLLISKYLLFKKAYNDKRKDCKWKNSTLNNYLNNEFYTNTFNEEEKVKIKKALVNNSGNRPGGLVSNNTKGNIFLLSIDEVKRYFETDDKRKAIFKDGGSGWYWLRSNGSSFKNASCVSFSGFVSEGGYGIDNTNIYVRPALWINL